ncbi:MAG: site-2 protease family protein [Oscillospiraceae bacterium]|jgi:regulator of sigma E protease|nr:site-2 protease family protein [Oscillospiraceae bacterium]
MYIVIAILIFGFLIVTHELGHFTAAKLFNVRVSAFAVGMGPALLKKQKGETLYALRAFPIGGFCAMEEDEESDEPRAFTNQVWWKRFIILFAGAFMNFVTGLVILLFIVPRSPAFLTPTITDFFEDSPYESAEGLREGDTFYKIDGHRVFFSSNVSFLLGRSDGATHDLVVIRNGEKVTLDDYYFVPLAYEESGETVMKYGLYFGVKETGVIAGLKYTWNCARDFVRMVWMGLSDLLTGVVGLRDLSGPVGIVGIISDVGNSSETAGAAVMNIGYLAAFIAVNLAVMNLLPIPALDGGRLIFLVITAAVERLMRKKLNPKYEGYIHAAGFALLIGLMALVMLSDIYKLVT